MRYTAFFRGINVGGKHIVKMADLRQLFTDCGFTGVQTIAQSGNVIFEAEWERARLASLISERFTRRFGFESRVMLRSAAEIDAIIAALPFADAEVARAQAADPETEHVYVFLSAGEIDPSAAAAPQSGYRGEGRLAAAKRELYLLCYHGILNSPLAAPLLKPGAAYFSRNLNTLRKIRELLCENHTPQPSKA